LRQPFRLAIKAKKHQSTQIAVDGSIASELVLTTLEATSDLSISAHALKGRAAFF
jgi:pentose-5-phosphate-3-epimerase